MHKLRVGFAHNVNGYFLLHIDKQWSEYVWFALNIKALHLTYSRWHQTTVGCLAVVLFPSLRIHCIQHICGNVCRRLTVCFYQWINQC